MSPTPGAGAKLALHGLVERSRANGPGERFVIWVQGCSLACPGCCNPRTHAPGAGRFEPVATLVERIVAAAVRVEGLTVSGGEPFEQPEALHALLSRVKARSALSVLAFSGYTLRELRSHAARARALQLVDVLVAGRFAERRRHGRGLLGSSNQRIHLLSARYTLAEVQATPEYEVHVAADGTVTTTGIGTLGVGPQ